MIRLRFFLAVCCSPIFFLVSGCGTGSSSPVRPDETVVPQASSAELLRAYMEATANDNERLDGLIPLRQYRAARFIYEHFGFNPVWSVGKGWRRVGDSLADFIDRARLFGLFPEDYHNRELLVIRKKFSEDSLSKSDREDVALWVKADILLTDGFIQLVRDLKLGRLGRDSVSLNPDTLLSDQFYLEQIQKLRNTGSVAAVIRDLEPQHPAYHALKRAIPRFLDSMDYRAYTVLPAPSRSPQFRTLLQRRLFEEGLLASDTILADSAQLSAAVKEFQKRNGLTADGRAGDATVRMMNLSDREKFIRVAISLDKYKQLPPELPGQYVWVNLPGYYLELWDDDSVRLSSRIICGKPATRTPLLNSAIAEVITYPQWTVPASIIQKEILPAVKKNPSYLTRKGFSLLDRDGNVVHPDSVDWSRYSKGIPYRVVQGSGDANALGVLKFNFSNKYAVYLHDTNQRYLFGSTTRALSHGCVRVQDWRNLAHYLLRRDSGSSARIDSLNRWLSKKEKHSIAIRNRVPLFIRYITCEAKEGKLQFYDDIYGEDQQLKKQYFPSK
ncbi:MAG TPA: L,D-transpeptidase family protein [Chitinophagaceae bacterium]|nr:L,D-transpeptidase family protein [Chitinophagaceae bacterium]